VWAVITGGGGSTPKLGFWGLLGVVVGTNIEVVWGGGRAWRCGKAAGTSSERPAATEQGLGCTGSGYRRRRGTLWSVGWR
jgi:hypothetical protein